MGKKYLGRVSQLIRRKLTMVLLEESNDPRLAEVNITDVQVNRDTTRAEVFYSVIGSQEHVAEIQAALDGAAGWMRAELAPSLRLRNIPNIVFTYDPSLEYGSKIDALLQQLHEQEDTTYDESTADATSDELVESV